MLRRNLKSRGGIVSKKLYHVKRQRERGVFYREIGLGFCQSRLHRSSELFKKVRRRRRKFFIKKGKGKKLLVKRAYSSFLHGKKKLCSISIVSLSYCRLTKEHFEGIRLCLRRVLSKRVVIFRRLLPWLFVHTKPLQVRMGKGKGSKLKTSLCFLKPGDIVFDIVGFYFVEFKKLEKVLRKYMPFRFDFLFLERL